MFGIFGNNTPRYQGQTQNSAPQRGGLLSFFTGGFALFPKTPVYATAAPVIAPQSTTTGEHPKTADAPQSGAEAETGAHETGSEEPQDKRITIIVTPGPGTTVDDVAAFFRERCGLDS